MTTGEAISILKDKGFEEVAQRGSHKKFKRGSERITIVYHSSDKEKVYPKTEKQIKNFK